MKRAKFRWILDFGYFTIPVLSSTSSAGHTLFQVQKSLESIIAGSIWKDHFACVFRWSWRMS